MDPRISLQYRFLAVPQYQGMELELTDKSSEGRTTDTYVDYVGGKGLEERFGRLVHFI